MKKQADELIHNLKVFVNNLNDKKSEKAIIKTKQLSEIKKAIKNLRDESVSVPNELIQLEEQLEIELGKESAGTNEILDYIKNEITTVLNMYEITSEAHLKESKMIQPKIIHEEDIIPIRPSRRIRHR